MATVGRFDIGSALRGVLLGAAGFILTVVVVKLRDYITSGTVSPMPDAGTQGAGVGIALSCYWYVQTRKYTRKK